METDSPVCQCEEKPEEQAPVKREEEQLSLFD